MMACLSKHGPLLGHGIYVGPSGHRYAFFQDGTVLKRVAGAWKQTALNAHRSDWALFLTPDTSNAAQAIISRTRAAAHAHEGAKKLRSLERRVRG